jgi:ribonuclease P protein component
LKKVHQETLKRHEIIRGEKETRELLGVKPLKTRFLWVHFMPGDHVKVAFYVPKRIGSAVLRNGLRRRMREIYRRNKQGFPAASTIFRLKEKSGWEELCKDFKRAAKIMAGSSVG